MTSEQQCHTHLHTGGRWYRSVVPAGHPLPPGRCPPGRWLPRQGLEAPRNEWSQNHEEESEGLKIRVSVHWSLPARKPRTESEPRVLDPVPVRPCRVTGNKWLGLAHCYRCVTAALTAAPIRGIRVEPPKDAGFEGKAPPLLTKHILSRVNSTLLHSTRFNEL